MPRAYEPGQRWEAFQDLVVEATPSPSGKQWTMARCEIGTEEQRRARARLIAESPERDELLHAIEEWFLWYQGSQIEPNPKPNSIDLMDRIRDTLGMTEQP